MRGKVFLHEPDVSCLHVLVKITRLRRSIGSAVGADLEQDVARVLQLLMSREVQILRSNGRWSLDHLLGLTHKNRSQPWSHGADASTSSTYIAARFAKPLPTTDRKLLKLGTSSADQQRLQISDLHFDKFPTPATFACWKMCKEYTSKYRKLATETLRRKRQQQHEQ